MPRIRTLVVALVLCAALAPPAGAAPAAPPRAFTVATYNIHHGQGLDDRVDLDRVAAEIRATGADVAALQEVDRHWGERSAFADQAAVLAERLDMHVTYAANLDLDPLTPGAPRRQYGTAILSRFPILASRNTLLPRPAGGEQRGLLEAVVQVRGVRVRIANTHFQHNSALEREAQSRAVTGLLAGAREPVVLAGDLNATPSASELAPLWPRFADAWTLGGEGAGASYPAEAPDRRIDYVLVSPGVDVLRSRVWTGTDGSDHLPVVADLAVPGALVGAPR